VPDRKLRVRITLVNEDKGYQFYEDVEDVDETNPKKVFRLLQREYGRCSSKLYRDHPGRPAVAHGWVFRKRVRYTDCDEYFVQEAWCELFWEEPAKRELVEV